MENDETTAQAAARETAEEARARIEVGEGWIATCKEARHIPEEIPRRTEQLIKLHRVFSQVGGEGYRFAEVNTPSSFL